jgi:hypothetical protein
VFVGALACASLGAACAEGREPPRASAGQAAAGQAARDPGPWIRVAGSQRRDELDTTTIIRTGPNTYQAWFRRASPSAQGTRGSYHVRYEFDCLAFLVRATQAAILSDSGGGARTLSRAELIYGGESLWNGPISRDLGAVLFAICNRVQDARLPIAKP